MNGIPVREPVVLRHGDRITVANFEFTFREINPMNPPTEEIGDGFSPTTTMMLTVQSQPMIFLVADIMGYTRISSKLPDGELGKLMSPWYQQCRDVLKANGGHLDKFIGDCVFAYWKSTGPRERTHAMNAARQLTEYHLKPSAEQTTMLDRESVDLRCGVGLHIGMAAVGSFTRGNQTALGDAVNLTFRVEKLTRTLEPDIVATSDFLEGWDVGKGIFVRCGEFQVEGIDRQIEVYGLGNG